jgi:hypothetical protein
MLQAGVVISNNNLQFPYGSIFFLSRFARASHAVGAVRAALFIGSARGFGSGPGGASTIGRHHAANLALGGSALCRCGRPVLRRCRGAALCRGGSPALCRGGRALVGRGGSGLSLGGSRSLLGGLGGDGLFLGLGRCLRLRGGSRSRYSFLFCIYSKQTLISST